PEAIFDAVIKLRKKIANESMQERGEFISTHRFYTRSHEMKTVAPILTGEYLASGTRDMPPKELMQAMGVPVADGAASDAKLEGSKVSADQTTADKEDKA
ncbi:MAG: hypothetical protein AAFY54_09385, partial [Cyanobacteria bacterium J06648_10]